VDRSSRPNRRYRPTPKPVVDQVGALRRQRRTGAQIAAELQISPATVSRILRRLGLNKLKALEPAEAIRRYEREHPGELIHIDIRKLGRIDGLGHRITGDRSGHSNRRCGGKGPGWEFVHVCIDDASRVAFAEVMAEEKKTAPSPSCALPRLLYKSARHDRQRLMLQVSCLPWTRRQIQMSLLSILEFLLDCMQSSRKK
jgi:hypothetical protein